MRPFRVCILARKSYLHIALPGRRSAQQVLRNTKVKACGTAQKPLRTTKSKAGGRVDASSLMATCS